MILLALLATLLAAATSATDDAGTLDALLATTPADSLGGRLRQFEREHGRVRDGAEAALVLGHLEYARGEYRNAAEAYTRAAARLDPTRKNEARYWAGLSWLALHEPTRGRALLEEVSQSEGGRRADALLGVAIAWEQTGRTDRALESLDQLLDQDPGEAGPAALERKIALAERLHRADDARRARARLLDQYPRSIEAARAVLPESETQAPSAAGYAVHIGAFTSAARARSLLTAAQRAGFAGARTVTRGEGKRRSFTIRLGVYPRREEATRAGEEAAKKLGVAYRLVSPP